MFEYIRSPDIYRATSLFAFTVLAYKKHPLGALAALVRYSPESESRYTGTPIRDWISAANQEVYTII